MKGKPGMTLIECLVYLSLFALIATFAVTLCSRLWLGFMRNASNQQHTVNVYSALDAFASEVATAPCDAMLWKERETKCLVWTADTSKNIDRGWAFHDGRLIRSEGNYSATSHTWISRNSATVLHIKNGEFAINKTDKQEGVTITCWQDQDFYQRKVHLKNRVYK